MKNQKILVLGMALAVSLAMTVYAMGKGEQTGASAAKTAAGKPAALQPKLLESLGKYTAPEIQNWGNDGTVSV